MAKLTCMEPQTSMYLLPNTKDTAYTSEEVCKRLLDETHVSRCLVVFLVQVGKNT